MPKKKQGGEIMKNWKSVLSVMIFVVCMLGLEIQFLGFRQSYVLTENQILNRDIKHHVGEKVCILEDNNIVEAIINNVKYVLKEPGILDTEYTLVYFSEPRIEISYAAYHDSDFINCPCKKEEE